MMNMRKMHSQHSLAVQWSDKPGTLTLPEATHARQPDLEQHQVLTDLPNTHHFWTSKNCPTIKKLNSREHERK